MTKFSVINKLSFLGIREITLFPLRAHRFYLHEEIASRSCLASENVVCVFVRQLTRPLAHYLRKTSSDASLSKECVTPAF